MCVGCTKDWLGLALKLSWPEQGSSISEKISVFLLLGNKAGGYLALLKSNQNWKTQISMWGMKSKFSCLAEVVIFPLKLPKVKWNETFPYEAAELALTGHQTEQLWEEPISSKHAWCLLLSWPVFTVLRWVWGHIRGHKPDHGFTSFLFKFTETVSVWHS